MLAVEMPHSDSDSDTNSDEVAAALMAMELKEVVFGHLQQALVVPGVCWWRSHRWCSGLGIKGWGRERGWCFDNGSSGHVTHDFAKMTNYPPSNKFLSVASGKQLPIESHGNLVVDFQSGQDFVHI